MVRVLLVFFPISYQRYFDVVRRFFDVVQTTEDPVNMSGPDLEMLFALNTNMRPAMCKERAKQNLHDGVTGLYVVEAKSIYEINDASLLDGHMVKGIKSRCRRVMDTDRQQRTGTTRFQVPLQNHFHTADSGRESLVILQNLFKSGAISVSDFEKMNAKVRN